jgi:hypothetical protein
MNRLIRLLCAIAALTAAAALGGCLYGPYEDSSAQYLHRTQTITTEAGNAQEINAATQVIDPWPRSAGNRNIPGNGDRTVNAAERYRAKSSPATPGQGGQSPVAGAGTVSTTPSSSSSPNTPSIPSN